MSKKTQTWKHKILKKVNEDLGYEAAKFQHADYWLGIIEKEKENSRKEVFDKLIFEMQKGLVYVPDERMKIICTSVIKFLKDSALEYFKIKIK